MRKTLKGQLVEEYMINNTKIQIYNDAYINKTQEEIDQIMENINKIAIQILSHRDSDRIAE